MNYHSIREFLEEDKENFIQACDYCSICLERCQPMPHQPLEISSFELMGRKLAKEVKSTGADKVITSCVGCDLTLGRIGCDYGFSAEMYMSFFGRALGIEYEDKLARYISYKNPDRVLEESREYIEASSLSFLEMEDMIPKLFPSE